MFSQMRSFYYSALLLLALFVYSCSKPAADGSVNPQPTNPTTSTPGLPPTAKFAYYKQGQIISTGETFVITGENLPTNSSDYSIKVNGTEVSHVELIDITPVVSGKALTQIRSCVPQNTTSGEVTLKVGSQTINLGEMTIRRYKENEYWKQITDFPGSPKDGSTPATMTLNGKAYIGLGSLLDFSGVRYDDFWEYDPSTNKWTKKANFPGGNRNKMASFSIGGKGYVGMGSPDYGTIDKGFWEYNPSTDKWTKMKDFPGERREVSYYFTIANRGYIGIYTIDSDSGKTINQLWEYNPSNDSWKQKASLPATAPYYPNSAQNLVINSSSYLLVDKKDLWQYDQNQDKWSQLTTITGPSGYDIDYSFVKNNLIYLGFSYFDGTPGIYDTQYALYSYNPATNKLNKEASVFAGAPRTGANAFVIGNQVYVGLGIHSKDIWTSKW
ncbi:hypothetical protein M0L20_29635 [Spirosoma sp. RP8]|uniref:IPT/TIG domain-containing protein n=1 Tax=Spirosoma liriopis TaxID=2937440 RepID=A0ABT0HV53_9BACT|nr:hypothetical protein [Spirosoma liriopis]MCK8496065.1 hypothetical protein [Spirosoma liriopis]